MLVQSIILLAFALPFSDLSHESASVRRQAYEIIVASKDLDSIQRRQSVSRHCEERILLDMATRKILYDAEQRDLDALGTKRRESNLAGWSQFSAIVGDTISNRQLYLQIYRQNRNEICSFYAGSPQKRGRIIMSLAEIDMWGRFQLDPHGKAMILLFACSETNLGVANRMEIEGQVLHKTCNDCGAIHKIHAEPGMVEILKKLKARARHQSSPQPD